MNEIKIVTKSIFRNYIVLIILIAVTLSLLSSKSQLIYNLIGYRSYVVLSESMMPSISPGDVVLVKNINRTTIKENDIVTFYEYDETVTHRIKEVLDNGYITKGDNNISNDLQIIKEENIVGKVVLIVPIVGKIFLLLSNPYIMSLELVLLGIILILNKVPYQRWKYW